jgi:hypothetical protein
MARTSSRSARSATWWPWVQRLLDARGWTPADLSRATSGQGRIDESVIGRWKNHGSRPEIESVRIVAKVFGRDIREAIVRAGFVTAKELNAAWPDLSEEDLAAGLSDDALIEEVRSRMRSKKQPQDSPQPRRRRAAVNTNGDGATTPVTTGPRSTEIATHGHDEAPPPRGEGEGADDDPVVLNDSALS